MPLHFFGITFILDISKEHFIHILKRREIIFREITFSVISVFLQIIQKFYVFPNSNIYRQFYKFLLEYSLRLSELFNK